MTDIYNDIHLAPSDITGHRDWPKVIGTNGVKVIHSDSVKHVLRKLSSNRHYAVMRLGDQGYDLIEGSQPGPGIISEMPILPEWCEWLFADAQEHPCRLAPHLARLGDLCTVPYVASNHFMGQSPNQTKFADYLRFLAKIADDHLPAVHDGLYDHDLGFFEFFHFIEDMGHLHGSDEHVHTAIDMWYQAAVDHYISFDLDQLQQNYAYITPKIAVRLKDYSVLVRLLASNLDETWAGQIIDAIAGVASARPSVMELIAGNPHASWAMRTLARISSAA